MAPTIRAMWKLSSILAVSVGLASAATPPRLIEAPCFEASAWREADSLFRRSPHWIGADGAYSIDLGNNRTMWLFGDTWIDPSGQQSRSNAQMIRNSVAIQTGADPSNATIKFYWQTTADEAQQAFFVQQGDEWFWPGHGVRLYDRLILFLNRLRGTDIGLGFASAGWNALMIDNPDDEPTDWRIKTLQTPSNPLGIIVGFASVLQWQEHLYAFGSQDPVKSHPIYVARWPVEKVAKGELREPEWWGGADIGWIADSSSTPRWPVFENGQAELTIHFDDVTHQFIAVQTVGFGEADLAIRSAPELMGGIIVGFASVLQWQEHLYAFGSQDPVKSHPIYVARWPVEKVAKGELREPEWWGGADIGWIADSSSTPRWPVFENGQAELTIHFDDVTHQFIAVQTVGFGEADLAIRSAPELTGPWTPQRTIYRPPEYDRPNVMIYAAKAHPQFAGADLVLTYATNTFKFREHLTDGLIYYPRFVRLARCE